MLSGSWARYAPLSGVLFVVLVVVSIIVSGFDSVGTDDSTQEVVDFWSDNDGQQIAAAIIGALAMVPFLWFLGVLRSTLRVAEGGTGRLSATAYAGGIVLVGFALVDSALQLAVADTVGDVPAGVTQSLSVLYSDFFLGFPIGFGTLMLATGLVLLRTRVLPTWLGWFALVLGILAFFGPVGFFAFLVFLVWLVITSVMLYQRGEPTAAPPPVAPTAPTA
jgi:hypothetical protein